MAAEIPDWREKKELLWGERSSDEERLSAGNAFFEAERFSEALDFFSRAGDRGSVEKVLNKAVELGDWFLFKSCVSFLEEERIDELRKLAANARERGKFFFALRACSALGDADGKADALHRIRDAFPDSSLLLSKLEEEAGIEPAPEEDGGGAGDTGRGKKRPS